MELYAEGSPLCVSNVTVGGKARLYAESGTGNYCVSGDNLSVSIGDKANVNLVGNNTYAVYGAGRTVVRVSGSARATLGGIYSLGAIELSVADGADMAMNPGKDTQAAVLSKQGATVRLSGKAKMRVNVPDKSSFYALKSTDGALNVFITGKANLSLTAANPQRGISMLSAPAGSRFEVNGGSITGQLVYAQLKDGDISVKNSTVNLGYASMLEAKTIRIEKAKITATQMKADDTMTVEKGASTFNVTYGLMLDGVIAAANPPVMEGTLTINYDAQNGIMAPAENQIIVSEVSSAKGFKLGKGFGKYTLAMGDTGALVLRSTAANVASVRIAGKTTNYADIQEAFAAIDANPAATATGAASQAVVKLLRDVRIENSAVLPEKPFTIDGQGRYNLSSSDAAPSCVLRLRSNLALERLVLVNAAVEIKETKSDINVTVTKCVNKGYSFLSMSIPNGGVAFDSCDVLIMGDVRDLTLKNTKMSSAGGNVMKTLTLEGKNTLRIAHGMQGLVLIDVPVIGGTGTMVISGFSMNFGSINVVASVEEGDTLIDCKTDTSNIADKCALDKAYASKYVMAKQIGTNTWKLLRPQTMSATVRYKGKTAAYASLDDAVRAVNAGKQKNAVIDVIRDQTLTVAPAVPCSFTSTYGAKLRVSAEGGLPVAANATFQNIAVSDGLIVARDGAIIKLTNVTGGAYFLSDAKSGYAISGKLECAVALGAKMTLTKANIKAEMLTRMSESSAFAPYMPYAPVSIKLVGNSTVACNLYAGKALDIAPQAKCKITGSGTITLEAINAKELQDSTLFLRVAPSGFDRATFAKRVKLGATLRDYQFGYAATDPSEMIVAINHR